MLRLGLYYLVALVACSPTSYAFLLSSDTVPTTSTTARNFDSRPTTRCMTQNPGKRTITSTPLTRCYEKKNIFGQMGDSIGNFFTELDNFMDDASARRLGNGAKFYGKRKSNFYGENDSMKKENPNQADPTEDYQVTAGGYFMWKQDEDGQMRPVTRMKKQVVEKGDSYWERIFSQDEAEKAEKEV